jgi:phosphohistidine phosphatase
MIYLVRHATAVEGDHGLPDKARWLTAAGRRAALALGRKLAEEKRIPASIWMSPLVRAVQTAELLAVGLGWTKELGVLPELAPDEPAKAVAKLLEEGAMAVGHEPQMTELARRLGQPIHGFRKAQILEVESGWTFTAD